MMYNAKIHLGHNGDLFERLKKIKLEGVSYQKYTVQLEGFELIYSIYGDFKDFLSCVFKICDNKEFYVELIDEFDNLYTFNKK